MFNEGEGAGHRLGTICFKMFNIRCNLAIKQDLPVQEIFSE